MNKNEVVQTVFEICKCLEKDIYAIYLYGSNQDLESDKKDIDLLVVVNSETQLYANQYFEQFDIIVMSKLSFERSLQAFEPLVIEPILYGTLIFAQRYDLNEVPKDMTGQSLM